MPATAETVSLGFSVAIDRIDRELKKLWSESEGAMTRASMMNLAVYSEEPDSLTQNTQLLARITENHACRGIVIGANPHSRNDRIEAWISAHCHVGRAGKKQVCSEQISFLLEGAKVKLLPSIVFSQLDSDLPLFLWWQSKFAEPMDPQLWSWIDRLIYDSQTWPDFNAQMRLVERAQSEAKQRAAGGVDRLRQIGLHPGFGCGARVGLDAQIDERHRPCGRSAYKLPRLPGLIDGPHMQDFGLAYNDA